MRVLLPVRFIYERMYLAGGDVPTISIEDVRHMMEIAPFRRHEPKEADDLLAKMWQDGQACYNIIQRHAKQLNGGARLLNVISHAEEIVHRRIERMRPNNGRDPINEMTGRPICRSEHTAGYSEWQNVHGQTLHLVLGEILKEINGHARLYLAAATDKYNKEHNTNIPTSFPMDHEDGFVVYCKLNDNVLQRCASFVQEKVEGILQVHFIHQPHPFPKAGDPVRQVFQRVHQSITEEEDDKDLLDRSLYATRRQLAWRLQYLLLNDFDKTHKKDGTKREAPLTLHDCMRLLWNNDPMMERNILREQLNIATKAPNRLELTLRSQRSPPDLRERDRMQYTEMAGLYANAYYLVRGSGTDDGKYLRVKANGQYDLVTRNEVEVAESGVQVEVRDSSMQKREAIKVWLSREAPLSEDEIEEPSTVQLVDTFPSYESGLRTNPLQPHPTLPNAFIYYRWSGFAFEYWSEYREHCATATAEQCAAQPAVRWYLGFVEKLIPDESKREYILKWTAFMFQKPDIRPETFIYLNSAIGGVGKDVFAEILQCAVGMHLSAANTRIKKILTEDGFTEDIDKVLIVADEIDPQKVNLSQLNNLCTSSHLTIRDLWEKHRRIKNMSHLIMTSNWGAKGLVNYEGRRIAFAECSSHWSAHENQQRNAEFVGDLVGLFGMNGKFSKQPSEHNRENIAWIGRYFLTMDIESFQVRRIPLCRDQLRMEKQGQSLEWGFFMTLDNHYWDKMVSYHGTSIIPHDLEYDEKMHGLSYKLSKRELYAWFKAWCHHDEHVRSQQISGLSEFARNSFQAVGSPAKRVPGFLTRTLTKDQWEVTPGVLKKWKETFGPLDNH
jgi:hypothetical protein